MRLTTLIRLLVSCLMVLGALFIFRGFLAQSQTPQTATIQATQLPASPADVIYDPYPPGILPADLNAELARILREIDVIEQRAIDRWHRLPPPIVTGQPPIIKDTGTERIETLGQLMNFDKRISPNQNQACASCHMPYVAFRLSRAAYRPLFVEVWGQGSFDINFPPETEQICAIPGGAAFFHGDTTPVNLSPADRIRSNEVYDHWGQSIDAYEQSVQVSAYSSKFDAFLAGNYTMT